ncbi:hypothetical protein H4W30_001219 [Amycolatopsis roodepoortensis]|uniref:Uncharacterized protein n=1 Tax=Amycolatopsis roodepoortensis TaxID=700274 RepID=A0ABR9L0P4_9PSEU|nr:hypothetical protein [Amycolatopsis roodepoortensis]
MITELVAGFLLDLAVAGLFLAAVFLVFGAMRPPRPPRGP